MKILPHEIIYCVIFFFAAALFILAWPRKRTPGGYFLLGHLVALAVWVFGLYFEAVSTTMDTKILWSQICYLGFTAVTPFFFLFVVAYTNQRRVNPFFALSLFIVPLLTDIAAWTNQWHHLLWMNFHWGSIQYNVLIYDHGIFFFLHLIYIYTLVFFGFIFLFVKILHSQPPFRSQLIIIFIGGLFPLVSGTLYAFNINLVQGLDSSSFGFLLTNIFLTLGFIRYQLLDLVPVARDALIARFQDGMIVLDWKNRIVEVNQNAKALLNIDDTNSIGKDYQELIPWPIDLQKLSRLSQPSEYWIANKDIYIDLQVSSLAPQSANPPGYLITFRDINSRKQAELQLQKANENLHNQINEVNHLQELLQEQATHDMLTGLHNRRLTDDVLNQQLEYSRQYQQPYSILVLDIDHFKKINDEFGHQTGDMLLEEYGKFNLTATRKNDFSCRLGGDEILMAFPNMTEEQAQKKANSIRQKLQSITVDKENQRISTTVSIGIATFPLIGDTVKELINWADQAMYMAKEKGRNQVVLASIAKIVREKTFPL